ncbi:hypothetical protein NLJ89_g11879 [Agrocybe chaxingu]|uniref:Uncharacterized protein n=1 Tax=Agrocybe chaxingu TaxID=84603 RepID=A0A9W8JP66_9AGAR|nr:hypothetical protein NLJ89_g11879 [Agrocybe chaxingu]
MSKPPKRPRTGESYHDPVPLSVDYLQIHAREGRLRRVGNTLQTSQTQRYTYDGIDFWPHLTSWEPLDDPEFALDPDSGAYDEAVEADVMQDPPVAPKKKQKKQRSQVSRRPHLVWKEIHCQNYLDEILRWEGRGDFRAFKNCPDCLARSVPEPNPAEYRCEECSIPDLVCEMDRATLHQDVPQRPGAQDTAQPFQYDVP